ncbi:MAG: ATP-binding cassette domain-containing protein [Rhodobacter sp.]|nr:ATP-binding cassette domain-containing protein [Rhodobacter sp.]
MAEGLSFDIAARFAGFTLEAQAEIPPTGITALSGPSGSGKTTLLRAIAGLEPTAERSVTFAGEVWTGKRPEARGIGYVFQDARLFPHLSVRQNLDYGARRRGTSVAELDAVIDALDLAALLPRSPERLSGGEARRVALGRALASRPRILLMDEPLTGLDRARKADLMPWIARAVAGFGVPALYVTHSQNEIAFLADRTLGIAEGRLTGWSPAAPQLLGRVVAAVDGRVDVALGDRTVRLAGRGAVGETWALPLGDAYVLSTQDPGHSTAPLRLPATLIEPPLDGQCRIEVAGQTLTLPWTAPPDAAPGTPLWLTLTRVTGRLAGPR